VVQAAYVYDGAGDRLQQVNYTSGSAITTTYRNDAVGLTQVLAADDGTEQVYNLYGLDLIAQDDGAETRTLLADGLGSARTEMVGPAVETVTTYGPYGKLLAQTGDSGTTYGFTGEQHDGATGLVYLRARYYNPGLKVFMSHDPFPGYAKQPQSQNGYNYAHNNPINYTDPTGNCIDPISGTACVIIAGAATVVVIYVAAKTITDALMPHVPDMSTAAMDFVDYCRTIVADRTRHETEAERQAREYVNSLPKPQPTPLSPDVLPTPDWPDDDKIQLYHYTNSENYSSIMRTRYIKWTDYDIFYDDNGRIHNWNGVNFTDISPREVRATPTDKWGMTGRHQLAYYLWFDEQEYPFTEYWIGIEIDKDEVDPVVSTYMYPHDSVFYGRPYYIYRSTIFHLDQKDITVTCGRTDDPIPFLSCWGMLPAGR
jgi:RHS repeat-associated protein